MKRIFFLLCLLGVCAAVGGCYQIHSDDDLRTVPVTNNPNSIPGAEGIMQKMSGGAPY